MTVLIVPDKFKGTLTAAAAADAIARGWRNVRPGDRLDLLPMSDGGDGFGEVMSGLLEAGQQTVKTVDAAHRLCGATWWWEEKSKTAIIESARCIGLAMLPRNKFHPFELDTFGLGALLRAARDRQAKRILIGIGGSATNDAGFGLARALGWEFLDGAGEPILEWIGLYKLVEIRPPQSGARRAKSAQTHFEAVRASDAFGKVIVAVDVQNRLLGVRGATRVYGPQKGIRPDDFELAERCLGRLANIMRQQFGRDFARVPGTGAAGGLGFGLLAFLDAKLEPGFGLFARLAKLERRLRNADLVITAEGAIDKSTLMGKGVGETARRCRAMHIPCIGLAGMVAPDCRQDKRFVQLRALSDVTNLARAKANPARWLERLAEQVAAGWLQTQS